jgi:hypothetical protein
MKMKDLKELRVAIEMEGKKQLDADVSYFNSEGYEWKEKRIRSITTTLRNSYCICDKI